eukprot:jgi/Botrbrau1/12573/Bobra.0169s0107.1
MSEAAEAVKMKWASDWQLSPASKDFLAGAGAGMAGVLAGQPLDTVRVRLQQRNCLFGGNFWRVAQSLTRREGIGALFKGAAYPLTTTALQSAVVFQAYGAACRTISGTVDPATPLLYSQVFKAGLFAGLIQTAIIVPVDLLKIRMQLQRASSGSAAYVGALQQLRHVVASQGLSGLYRGTTITLIRDVPSHGVYFAAFEMGKEWLEPGSRSNGSHNPLAVLTAGGLAGAVSWLSVYPFDTIKSRIQAQAPGDMHYRGWVDCALKSIEEEGPRALWRGLAPTLVRAFLVNSTIFFTYEFLLKLMHTHDPADSA